MQPTDDESEDSVRITRAGMSGLQTQHTANDQNDRTTHPCDTKLLKPGHQFPVNAFLATCHHMCTPADVFSFGMLMWQLFADDDLQTVPPAICSRCGALDEHMCVCAGASRPLGRASVRVRGGWSAGELPPKYWPWTPPTHKFAVCLRYSRRHCRRSPRAHARRWINSRLVSVSLHVSQTQRLRPHAIVCLVSSRHNIGHCYNSCLSVTGRKASRCWGKNEIQMLTETRALAAGAGVVRFDL